MFKLIHSTDSQSLQVVITIFTHAICPSVPVRRLSVRPNF